MNTHTHDGLGLAGQPATVLVGMLAAGEVSAREVLDDHLALVEARNPGINAICTLTRERAQADADRADQAFASGYRLGPLHGVPIVHKDTFETAGVVTTYGSETHVGQVPSVDASLVRRCKAAGATMLGKTNTPQFATGGHTSNRVFGTTVNPVDPRLTAGGSSGGSAAALAAHMTPLATGSDMAGSLRAPSAFCGVVGVRPTPGRVPLWPGEAVDFGMTVAGPMARNVDDAALLLSVMAGFDPRVPTSLRAPGYEYWPLSEPVTQPRVAWCPAPEGTSVDSRISAIIGQVPTLLQQAGLHVEAAMPNLDGARGCFEVLRAYQYAANYGHWLDVAPDLIGPLPRANIEKGAKFTEDDRHRALEQRNGLVDITRQFFTDVDVLIVPGSAVLPFPATQWTPDGGDSRGGTGYLDWLEPYLRLSVVGVPVVLLPVGFTDEGLPVSVQVVTASGRDDLALRFARLLERLLPSEGLRSTQA